MLVCRQNAVKTHFARIYINGPAKALNYVTFLLRIEKVPAEHNTNMEARLQMRNGEEEEVMGMDLKTRRRSHHNHKLHTTSPRGSESSITSDSSDEDVLVVENNDSNGTSNGENSTILESGSANEEAQVEAEPMFEGQKEENLEDPNGVADEIVVDFNGVSFSTNEGRPTCPFLSILVNVIVLHLKLI